MISHELSFKWNPNFPFETATEFMEARDEYLARMDETPEQAIYRLNKYCLVNWGDNPFDYLDELLVRNSKYSEFNFCGGRFGRKTFEISHFIAKLMAFGYKYQQLIAVYGFRLYGADILELKKEIVRALNDYGFKESESKSVFKNGDYIYSAQNNTPHFRFANGSFIYLKGIYKTTTRAIALKGLASAQGKDIAVIFQEEANEFTDADTQAIRMAVRDAKRRLYFSASNPDELFQDYIAYCDYNFKFDEKRLENEGQMFHKVFDNQTERGKVFHYTNHRINPYLTRDEVVELLELKKNDPHKYKVWGLGLPGGMEQSVFSPYMKERTIDFQPRNFVAGMDIGYATSQLGHPMRVVLSAVNLEGTYYQPHPRVHPIAEYYHSNANMVAKNIKQITEEVVRFLISEANKQPIIKQQGLDVKVDYGSGGLAIIEQLNDLAGVIYDGIEPANSWLHFSPTDKKIWHIRDRIDITTSLLSKGVFTMNKNDTPWLGKEMLMIQWQKKRTIGVDNTPKMIDLNDDGGDAFMYSIMPIANDLMRDFRTSRLFNKQYKSLKRINANNPDDMEG